MGVDLNPEWKRAADYLIQKCEDLEEAQQSGDEDRIKKAAQERREAESVYCSLQGMIDGGKTEEEVQKIIDSKMAEVSVFYS